MTWKHQILAVVTLMGVSTCAWAGDGRADEGSLISPHWLDAPVFTDGLPRVDGESMFLARAQSPYYGDYVGDTAVRFGYWGTTLSGSPNKVYEFSGDAPSSPFFDVDRLTSDGEKTVDFHITGTESESTDVGLYFFRPGLSVDIDYERFLHRLDHDPLSNFNDPTPPFLLQQAQHSSSAPFRQSGDGARPAADVQWGLAPPPEPFADQGGGPRSARNFGSRSSPAGTTCMMCRTIPSSMPH